MTRSLRIALKLLWTAFLMLVLVLLWRSEMDFVYRAF